MVRLKQTVHLSYIKISSISKWTKTSFHLSLVTSEYHRVHPKWFLSRWYIWHKLCTYFAPTPTLSLNKKIRHFTWPMSARSSIGCVQNNFWAYDRFDANRAPILRWDKHYFQTDRNKLPLEPHRLVVPSVASKTISEPTVCLAQTVHLSCTNTNVVSKW
jgi:hypothetical protein